MPIEIGNRLVLRIEVVLRVERRVPVELEARAVHRIGARARHRVDDASGRSSEFGGIRIGQHLELEDRFDAEEHAGGRSGRFVVHVVDVGAVEQEAVLLGTRAVDRNLRRTAADDVVAGGQRRRDARLQQRELLERSAIERQLANLLVAHETAHRPRRRVDDRRRGGHGHFLGEATELQPHVDHRVLTDGELHAAPDNWLKTGLGDMNFIGARRQNRHPVVSRRIGLELPHAARRRTDDDDLCVRHRAAARVGDDALEACADGLGASGTRHTAGQDADGNDDAGANGRACHDRLPWVRRCGVNTMPVRPTF